MKGYNIMHNANIIEIIPAVTVLNTGRDSLISVYTVCHSICIFWMHYCIAKQNYGYSIFKTVTIIILDAPILKKFPVLPLTEPHSKLRTAKPPYSFGHSESNRAKAPILQTFSQVVY